MPTQPSYQIQEIPISRIQPSPLNPRKHFDLAAIEELAASISATGLIQPITVRPVKGDKYEIVAGERRYRACKSLDNMNLIHAIVRELSEEQALDIMITENLQRKDIHPMEEAAGFEQLVKIKHITPEEIGLRVGKSASYVAQRLVLNKLIDPIQEFFFKGYLLIKDAMKIAVMHPDDQFKFYTEYFEGQDQEVTISAWMLRSYSNRLDDAPFDITDATINPAIGACTNCHYNSACQNLLFPEEAHAPRCSNSDCFKEKSTRSFQVRLEEIKDDPTTVMITDEYHISEDTKKFMKSHEGVLKYGEFSELSFPDPPERSDFDGDNDTDEEDEADFQSAMKDYEDEVKEYHEKVNSGKYIKALHVGGDDKGKITYIKLKAKGKEVKSSTQDGTLSAKEEIERLKERMKRGRQLDENKAWEEIKKIIEDCEQAKTGTGNVQLSELEVRAIAIVLKSCLGWSSEFDDVFFDQEAEEDNVLKQNVSLVEMLRFAIYDKLPPHYLSYGFNSNAKLMIDILTEDVAPVTIEELLYNTQRTQEKREKKAAARIAQLEAEIAAAKQKGKKKSVKDLIA